MPQYKISMVKRNSTKKDGTPFKNGDHRVVMQLEGVDGYISFFDRAGGPWSHLSKGMPIDGTIVEKNGFKNFEPSSSPAEQPTQTPPNPTAGSVSLEETNQLLKSILSVLMEMQGKGTTVDEVEVEDLPF